jgi:hypothetical protein
MNDPSRSNGWSRWTILWIGAIVTLCVGLIVWGAMLWKPDQASSSGSSGLGVTVGEQRERDRRVEQFCSSCHVPPPPGSFPKEAWPDEVRQGFEFAEAANRDMTNAPSFQDVLQYFDRRAPAQLIHSPAAESRQATSISFEQVGISQEGYAPTPGVSFVRFVQLSPPHERVIVASDMREGLVLLHNLDRQDSGCEVIAHISNPAHIEPIDLDQDGYMDLLVANLASLRPGNHTNGQVVWLRRDPQSESYEAKVLAAGLGRVADVEAADFDGDGDLDLIVAAFGWRKSGSVTLLENVSKKPSEPEFVSHVLEQKTGAIHVPVADINSDGKPDFVALFSQEHEQIIAFINQGGNRFRQEILFAAADPAYGSTGIQLVDFDHDGDIDVLYTNGDSMDSMIIKPYHGVQWLENEGTLPFRYHRVATLPGVHRALAVDLDGDGDMDVVAASFLPNTLFADRHQLQLDALIWLENQDGEFLRHVLERELCDHAALDIADCDGDGRPDLIVGNFTGDGLTGPRRLPPMKNILSIWFNRPSRSETSAPK